MEDTGGRFRRTQSQRRLLPLVLSMFEFSEIDYFAGVILSIVVFQVWCLIHELYSCTPRLLQPRLVLLECHVQSAPDFQLVLGAGTIFLQALTLSTGGLVVVACGVLVRRAALKVHIASLAEGF
jgi:hypothetical protein